MLHPHVRFGRVATLWFVLLMISWITRRTYQNSEGFNVMSQHKHSPGVEIEPKLDDSMKPLVESTSPLPPIESASEAVWPASATVELRIWSSEESMPAVFQKTEPTPEPGFEEPHRKHGHFHSTSWNGSATVNAAEVTSPAERLSIPTFTAEEEELAMAFQETSITAEGVITEQDIAESDAYWEGESVDSTLKTSDFNDDKTHEEVVEEFVIMPYVRSIMELNYTSIPRLQCPTEQSPGLRYEALGRNVKTQHGQPDTGIEYLFAMDIHQSLEVLPRLMSSIIQATRFLGPERCGISIVEGRSTDGTYEVLNGLHEPLSELGVRYWLQQSEIEPWVEDKDRVEELAKLRNLALAPLMNETYLFMAKPRIIYTNDIVVCTDDILEMLYQHELQGAVQTCAIDWETHGEYFYDIWVSRGLSGSTLVEIPQTGKDPKLLGNLFWDEPFTKRQFERGEAVQVFSCWNGLTVIEAQPFVTGAVKFRRNVLGECYGGEPMLLGSDLAKLGLSRVQMLPQVNVGYGYEGEAVKMLRGYVHEKVNVSQPVKNYKDDTTTVRIKWKRPPPRIWCMPWLNYGWWVDSWFKSGTEEQNPREINCHPEFGICL